MLVIIWVNHRLATIKIAKVSENLLDKKSDTHHNLHQLLENLNIKNSNHPYKKLLKTQNRSHSCYVSYRTDLNPIFIWNNNSKYISFRSSRNRIYFLRQLVKSSIKTTFMCMMTWSSNHHYLMSKKWIQSSKWEISSALLIS